MKKQNAVSLKEKQCRRCKITKARNHFTKDKNRPGGLTDYCRPCRSVMKATSKYKISEAEVEALWSSDCEICGSDQNIFIDHCHKTDIVRGALCRNCNHGIGQFFDNPKNLRRAAEYLERPR